MYPMQIIQIYNQYLWRDTSMKAKGQTHAVETETATETETESNLIIIIKKGIKLKNPTDLNRVKYAWWYRHWSREYRRITIYCGTYVYWLQQQYRRYQQHQPAARDIIKSIRNSNIISISITPIKPINHPIVTIIIIVLNNILPKIVTIISQAGQSGGQQRMPSIC